ncbi:hypothetical protein OAP83_02110 [Rickettsiales bacterium]|nr:hypothetical protein [Rickettsiales bacterium]
MSTNYQKHGIKRLEKLLAGKFALDLGIINKETVTWNAYRFRKQNPMLQLNKCRYTNTSPVDLHHLLNRSEYPEYTYHSENIVAINPHLHAYITRRSWSEQLENIYNKAQQEWLLQPNGKKTKVFDNVFKQIINECNNSKLE